MALGAPCSGRRAVLLTPRGVREAAGGMAARDLAAIAAPSASRRISRMTSRSGASRTLTSTGLDLSCWRVAGCGAEPIHAPTLAGFADKFRASGFRDDQLSARLWPRRARARRDVVAARTRAADRAPARPTTSTSGGCGDARAGKPRRNRTDHGGQLRRRRFPVTRCRSSVSDGRSLPERADRRDRSGGPSVSPGYYNE